MSIFVFFSIGSKSNCLWLVSHPWSQSQLSQGEGRVLPGQVASSWQGPQWWQRPPRKVPAAHQEQFGVQYLAQGHFDMQLSSARPALPAEPQTPQLYPNVPQKEFSFIILKYVPKNILKWPQNKAKNDENVHRWKLKHYDLHDGAEQL